MCPPCLSIILVIHIAAIQKMFKGILATLRPHLANKSSNCCVAEFVSSPLKLTLYKT